MYVDVYYVSIGVYKSKKQEGVSSMVLQAGARNQKAVGENSNSQQAISSLPPQTICP